MTVLVAEDDALIGMALIDSISGEGDLVIGPVATLDEALGLASRQSPEIAFVNVRLRDGSTGEILARVLRQQFATTVFLITADRRVSCEEAGGALAIIRKPYLMETISEALALAKMVRAGERVAIAPASGIELCEHGDG